MTITNKTIIIALGCTLMAITLVLGSIGQDFEQHVQTCLKSSNYDKEGCIRELSR